MEKSVQDGVKITEKNKGGTIRHPQPFFASVNLVFSRDIGGDFHPCRETFSIPRKFFELSNMISCEIYGKVHTKGYRKEPYVRKTFIELPIAFAI